MSDVPLSQYGVTVDFMQDNCDPVKVEKKTRERFNEYDKLEIAGGNLWHMCKVTLYSPLRDFRDLYVWYLTVHSSRENIDCVTAVSYIPYRGRQTFHKMASLRHERCCFLCNEHVHTIVSLFGRMCLYMHMFSVLWKISVICDYFLFSFFVSSQGHCAMTMVHESR